MVSYLEKVSEGQVINHDGNLIICADIAKGAIINITNGGCTCYGKISDNVTISVENNDFSSCNITCCFFSYTSSRPGGNYSTFGETGGKLSILGDISNDCIFKSSLGIKTRGNVGAGNTFNATCGPIELEEGCGPETIVNSISGKIFINKFLGSGSTITSVTGKIELEYSNFPNGIAITSKSGDIIGELIGKESTIVSESGGVEIYELHESSTIKTVSGDISVSNFAHPVTEISSTSGAIYRGEGPSVIGRNNLKTSLKRG